MGLGLDKGLLQQKAIADGAGTAAVAAPISGEGLNPPAELLGSATDGAISATGPAMEQQMDRPANGGAVAPKGAPNEFDRSPAVPAQPQGTSMNSTSSTLHARTLLAHPLGAGQHPHPAAGHAVLAACFKDLQPAVLVAVALVVQASTDGVGSLCPDLIHQPLRGMSADIEY